MHFEEFVTLAPYTTLHIGGPARWFAEARTDEEVAEAVRFARARALPFFVLGGGSNLLVRDAGFAGLVIHMGLRGIRQDEGRFAVAAGEAWDSFVSHAVERGYAGIECLAGIPGTVGATPVQNVGAYGQEVAETIVRVRAFDTKTDKIVDLAAAECGFAYRRSLFNSVKRGRYIVTAVTYALRAAGEPRLSYADLQRRFPAGTRPTLEEVSETVREIRQGKGMLIVEGEPDCRSAGSFFKNPVVEQAHYARIAGDAAAAVPSYPAGEGRVKLPAAWLVEHAGFPKGYTMGRAGISSRHTLALINRGEATADDVLALAERIKAAVREKFGVELEMEPVVLG
ncbi:MAG: UDP-N-acetylmuramate dehydrogenase [Acidobacteria bacterium]|jgi:UDP-N-acetylmuramate dehydrogenase|nr:UDP-N-acetylmuramate dehydrogenase [Acidobacteriota bacterium]